MDYKTLKWDTLEFVKDYLFRRLADPLTKAISSVEQTKNAGEKEQAQISLNMIEAQRDLAVSQCLIKAWSTLIEWKNGAAIPEENRQTLAPQQLPSWLLDYLAQRAVIKFEQTHYLYVHPEVFYESVMLLVAVTEKIGKLSHIMLNDAAPPRAGVWLRVVFEAPKDSAYPSKLAVLDRVDTKKPEHRHMPLEFAVVEDLFEYNNCRISLQNNTRTGHQAFAVLLPTTEQKPKTGELRPLEAGLAGKNSNTTRSATTTDGVDTGEAPIVSQPTIAVEGAKLNNNEVK